MNKADTLTQQRTDRVLKEPRNHIHLDSVDLMPFPRMACEIWRKEQRGKFCGGIHEAQKECTDMEDKDGVRTWREIYPLFTIEVVEK